ncbi:MULTISPECIES: SapB/AmfS family lanthipeptide [unclassified Crossiella]|nr:SapB/AmfS family lanthipeptide [Crossiella sp. SN42]MCO1579999.1 SapB/AmfS family lanthipeptide [Crossiella sp. SN42]
MDVLDLQAIEPAEVDGSAELGMGLISTLSLLICW